MKLVFEILALIILLILFAAAGIEGREPAEMTVWNSARNVEVPLRINRPGGEGPFPLIIWSHGAGGSNQSYSPLVNPWVEAGYAVIQPTHADSLQNKRIGFLKTLRDLEGWEERPSDIVSILDNLDRIEASIKVQFDRTRIGMGGHSFGAHTSMLLAGTTAINSQGKRLQCADERIRAFLLISAQGVGGEFDTASWMNVYRPMMTITGTKDRGRKGDEYTWRLDPFHRSPGGDSVMIILDGADHAFGGIAHREGRQLRKVQNEGHRNTVIASSLAFWDMHLKEDAEAISLINEKDLSAIAGTPVTIGMHSVAMKIGKDIAYQPDNGEKGSNLLDIYSPSGVTNAPVIVFIHGGGWRSGDKDQNGTAWTKGARFTREGMIFVTVNYRISKKVTFREQTADIQTALDWVKQEIPNFRGDPQALFLMGHSAGAHLAALYAVNPEYWSAHDTSGLQGVILLDGAGYDIPFHLESFAGEASRRLYQKIFSDDPAEWKAASPWYYISKEQPLAPVLAFYAGQRISSELQSRSLVKRIKESGWQAFAAAAPHYSHASINTHLGIQNDAVTEKVLNFIRSSNKHSPHN